MRDRPELDIEAMFEQRLELVHHTVIPVLGFPVRYESNSPEVLAIAEEAFGSWRVLNLSPELLSSDRPRVRVLVQDGDEGCEDHAPIHHSIPRFELVTFETPGSRGVMDSRRREAVAHVTAGLVRDRHHFRYGMLEALTLSLLTRLDRQPFHAAGLARGRSALLLVGPSGSGKSTLSYAALRAGFKLLAEDVVYLQGQPRLRVWGMPGFLHLPPEARRFFPELSGRQPTLLANGKVKLALRAREVGEVSALPVAERIGICRLSGAGSGSGVVRLSPEELEAAGMASREPGFDIFADTIGPVLGRVIREGGGWRLRLGSRPAEALPFLHEMFDELDSST